MAEPVKQARRRVVTGNDREGRSRVVFDGPAPITRESAFQLGTNMTEIWQFDTYPPDTATDEDATDRPFHFEPAPAGAVMRVVESTARRSDYSPELDTYVVPEFPPEQTEGGTWERGGQNLFTTRIHKSQTLDFGVLLAGTRVLLLDDGEYVVHPGDVVIQIGSWHAWSNPDDDSSMAFVMMGGEFETEVNG